MDYDPASDERMTFRSGGLSYLGTIIYISSQTRGIRQGNEAVRSKEGTMPPPEIAIRRAVLRIIERAGGLGE